MIHVAAVILTDEAGKILICKRGEGGSCAFLWEFPGGKVEEGESAEQAAVRECKEELGLDITLGPAYASLDYSYPDKDIHFTFFNGRVTGGEMEVRVHEEACWVAPAEMKDYNFCPADVALVERLAWERQIELPVMPAMAASLIGALNEQGFEAWAVGGCVRDSLLGKDPKDWDLCTSARPDQVKECFAGTYKVLETGIQHGTVTVLAGTETYEITTYRAEGDYEDHRRPEEVTFVNSLEEDLARRDFTINAMAMGPDGTVIDPFGGQGDLKNGVLRCVGDPAQRFGEDALRILRLLRFASVLGFAIEEETLAAAHAKKSLLRWVSGERMAREMTQLLCGKAAHRVAAENGEVLAYVMPEIEPALTFTQKRGGAEQNLWQHAADTLAYAPDLPEVRWAMLLRDIGKPWCRETLKEGDSTFEGHAEVSAQLADCIMRRLKVDRNSRETICQLIRFHGIRPATGDVSVRRWLNLLGPHQVNSLVHIWWADVSSHHAKGENLKAFEKTLADTIKNAGCYATDQLAVTGGNLLTAGLAKPGPSMSNMLDWLLHEVVEGRVENTREALLAKAREWQE